MHTRVVVGAAGVAAELRAAGALAERVRAPVTARAPWLTTVLDTRAGSPVAVVVETPQRTAVAAAAFLHVRRRGLVARVTALGDGPAPLPGGRPTTRLLARDEEAAGHLADGITDVVQGLRGPWSLRLAGLPLGDPTSRRVAARFTEGRTATRRSTGLVDELDALGPVVRSRDARQLERWLPLLLAAEPDRRVREFVRAAARLHAVTGELEVAVVPDASGEGVRSGLLTLLDRDDRWPWWGPPGAAGLRPERGAPLAEVSVPVRSLLPAPDVARRLGGGRG
ncbi:hypothetical protein [Blastococcus sp. CCUG 61487]|uniref:hypothetical protein n=1 Tax=Blastococcus sp. CCUG 61487 TaxID=1840703 RepID=UPI0010C10A3C|nr:hypothetical protein [Blastococcus sp. CCUG 61487]TKJ16712.1 hypothetical protein A6V29_13355 [Blastococcus sp. CCUG 61487]